MRLLDLFCGAGGAAYGYARAGFMEIVGVDIVPQPHYPYQFVRADALSYVIQHGAAFDAIHASPPCQAYTQLRRLPNTRGKDYPALIPETVCALEETRRPWVLENVMGARLDAGWLCGLSFGRPFFRHRYFQSNWLWLAPMHIPHHTLDDINSPESGLLRPHGSGGDETVANMRKVYGIDWMGFKELRQAVPPCYTQYIGAQLLRYISQRS